jgi:hypothetical protein
LEINYQLTKRVLLSYLLDLSSEGALLDCEPVLQLPAAPFVNTCCSAQRLAELDLASL